MSLQTAGESLESMTSTADEATQALSAAKEYDDYALVINAMPLAAAHTTAAGREFAPPAAPPRAPCAQVRRRAETARVRPTNSLLHHVTRTQ